MPAPRAVSGRASVTWSFRFAALSVTLLAGLFALQQFVDLDVLWHVRTGEWIARMWQIPRTDPFGGRTAGIPWLDVAWGFQVLAAALADRAGLSGLQIAVVALVMATLAVHFRAAPRTPLVLGGALLFVLVCGFRFLVRPDVLTFPLAITAMVLIERLARKPASSIILIALLTAGWANLHGSFVLVPLLLLASVPDALSVSARPRALRDHATAFLVSTLAPLANPYGLRIYGVLTPYLRSMLAAIGFRPPDEGLPVSEWIPTWRAMVNDTIFPTSAFVLFVLLLAISFLLRGTDVSRGRIACAALTLAMALAAVRHLLPFGAVALWIMSRNERDRLAADRAPATAPVSAKASASATAPAIAPFDAGWFRVAAALGVVAVTWSYLHAVASDRYYVERNLPVVTGVGINPEVVPEGAVRWLATYQPPGNLFNNYDSGAYLLYRLQSHVRTYIDPRFDVTSVNREIQAALHDPGAFEALMDRDGIGSIVLRHPSPESLSLLPLLSHDPRWTLAFRDANSTIHVRADSYPPPERPQPIALEPPIEPAAAGINSWLGRLKRECLPAAERTDAFVSGLLGDHERESDAYRRALARCPGDPKALAFFAGGAAAPGS